MRINGFAAIKDVPHRDRKENIMLFAVLHFLRFYNLYAFFANP